MLVYLNTTIWISVPGYVAIALMLVYINTDIWISELGYMPIATYKKNLYILISYFNIKIFKTVT